MTNKEYCDKLKDRTEIISELVENIDYEELARTNYATLYCELTGDNDVQIEFDNGNAIFRMRVLVDGIGHTEWRRIAKTGEFEDDLRYGAGLALSDCDYELLTYIYGRTLE